MSKKHYIVIAQILNHAYEHNQSCETRYVVKNIAYALVEFFQRDNKNFDVQKFIVASLGSDE